MTNKFYFNDCFQLIGGLYDIIKNYGKILIGYSDRNPHYCYIDEHNLKLDYTSYIYGDPILEIPTFKKYEERYINKICLIRSVNHLQVIFKDVFIIPFIVYHINKFIHKNIFKHQIFEDLMKYVWHPSRMEIWKHYDDFFDDDFS